MAKRWALLAGLALIVAGCRHTGTRVETTEEVNPGTFRRLAVMPFSDTKGQGKAVAEAVTAGLTSIMYEPANAEVVGQILREHKPDNDTGVGLETLELIRQKASADALVMGRMAPDWSSVFINVVDTEMGEPVLRAFIKPADKKQKAFSSPAEVAQRVLEILAGKRR